MFCLSDKKINFSSNGTYNFLDCFASTGVYDDKLCFWHHNALWYGKLCALPLEN
jgi:hypothetical protein